MKIIYHSVVLWKVNVNNLLYYIFNKKNLNDLNYTNSTEKKLISTKKHANTKTIQNPVYSNLLTDSDDIFCINSTLGVPSTSIIKFSCWISDFFN